MTDTPKARVSTRSGANEGAPSGFDRTAVAQFLARNGILVAFAVFIIGFTLAEPRFIGMDNVMGVIRSSAILGVMALGVTFVVISGNLTCRSAR